MLPPPCDTFETKFDRFSLYLPLFIYTTRWIKHVFLYPDVQGSQHCLTIAFLSFGIVIDIILWCVMLSWYIHDMCLWCIWRQCHFRLHMYTMIISYCTCYLGNSRHQIYILNMILYRVIKEKYDRWGVIFAFKPSVGNSACMRKEGVYLVWQYIQIWNYEYVWTPNLWNYFITTVLLFF